MQCCFGFLLNSFVLNELSPPVITDAGNGIIPLFATAVFAALFNNKSVRKLGRLAFTSIILKKIVYFLYNH